MDLILSNADISELDKHIQETPFKYAYPMFQFLKNKINEQAQKEAILKEQDAARKSQQNSEVSA